MFLKVFDSGSCSVVFSWHWGRIQSLFESAVLNQERFGFLDLFQQSSLLFCEFYIIFRIHFSLKDFKLFEFLCFESIKKFFNIRINEIRDVLAIHNLWDFIILPFSVFESVEISEVFSIMDLRIEIRINIKGRRTTNGNHHGWFFFLFFHLLWLLCSSFKNLLRNRWISLFVIPRTRGSHMKSVHDVGDLFAFHLHFYTLCQKLTTCFLLNFNNSFLSNSTSTEHWNFVFCKKFFKKFAVFFRHLFYSHNVHFVCNKEQWFVTKKRFDTLQQRKLLGKRISTLF
mmetsp:Transcript_5090/g.6201  ORF Transcript_5090/g.6201 Transcript_5090/m.6201 type:complete len:284 (+) Transcript_5090:354-1205(+)